MSALTQPHTNGHDRELNGVRTYRGRKLEDLIPQIRAELGPDAIILRQREGLMGGVGGFFAQKCVEVDAQAAPHAGGHDRIDIYDEDEPVNGWDEGLEDYMLPTPAALPAPEPSAPASEPPTPALEQPAPVPADPAPEPAARWAQEADAFVTASSPGWAGPESPAPASAPTDLTAESFVSRL